MDKTENLSRSWLVVMAAALFFFYSFIQMTIFSTAEMKDYFADKLSIPDTAAFGVFAGMFLIGCVIFLIPAGILLDKFSVKKLILVSVLLAVTGVIGLTFTQNLAVAKFFRFLTGIAHCVAFMAPLRLAPRWFPSKKLALAVGLVITIAVTGGLISQTPIYLTITAIGGEKTMLLNIALGVLVFILVFFACQRSPCRSNTKRRVKVPAALGRFEKCNWQQTKLVFRFIHWLAESCGAIAGRNLGNKLPFIQV
jgi:MFS family permease